VGESEVDEQPRLCQVVSKLIYCLYISGKRSEEEKEHSDTHQVVSELISVCILQTEGERGRKHSDTHIKWYQS
jgi:hypothetical protein